MDPTRRLPGARGALAAALLLAVGMMVLAAGVGPAGAAFPGKNGKIAFSKENFRRGTSGIFVIDPDGGGQAKIGPAFGYSPSWSADGRKVVFARVTGEGERDYNEDIFVMNADGTGRKQITSTRAHEYSPSFFPDGETIAFVRHSNRNGADIFAMKLDGTGLRKLTDDPGFYEESLAVSPDGQKIAYSRFNRSSDVFVMDADGTDRVNLTSTGRVDEFGADWSPNGRRIAFTSYRFSWSESGLAARAAEAQEGEAFTPEALARESSEPGEPGEPEEDVEISVMNADGTGRKDLTSGPAFDALPAFSPNGNKIVFSRMTFDERSEESELVVMRANGTHKRQLTDTPRSFEYDADWQPLARETATPD